MKALLCKQSLSIRRTCYLAGILLVLFFGFIPHVMGQATTMDSFDSTQTEEIPPDPDYGYVDDSAVLGGQRDIYTDRVTGSGTQRVTTGTNVGDGTELSHSQDRGVYGYTIVSWDGMDDDAQNIAYEGLGGIDLGPGSNGFSIKINYTDQAGSQVIVRVYTNANYWSEASITNIPSLSSPAIYSLGFSSFVQGSGATGPADFRDVGAIALEIDGRTLQSLDMAIDWIQVDGPTAVDIASFTATPAGGAVSVEWVTANETDLLGFNVWRSQDASGADVQLNNMLIGADNPGTPLGSSYTYIDDDVAAGNTYYYWLEAIETIGAPATWLGPVDATLGFRFYLPLVQRR